MTTSTDYEEFINFLKLYQSEEFGERLHQALFYVIAEGEVYEEKQEVCEALFFLRGELNKLQTKYLPVPVIK